MKGRYVSIFWRLVVPNVTVLCVACGVLILEPANGGVPALAGGLAVMVFVNVVLIRRATTPLVRLTRLMGEIEPLRPGQRLPVPEAQSELTFLAEAFNDMLDRLESERRESGMRGLREREEERRRVAGELHDEIGQTLTALAFQADRLLTQMGPDLADGVRDLRDGILDSVEGVRRVARELRPEALDTLGLIAALTNLAQQVARRTGIEIERRLERDLPPIDEEVEMAIYRVAQESLTNAVRHASARRIEMTLRSAGDGVMLSVGDDGIGYSPDGGRDGGILGMRERALSIGARLHIVGGPDGAGTHVVLEVPVYP